MRVLHDVPSSEGVKNGLKRAKRLVEAAYTPVKQLPIIIYSVADGVRTYHETVSNAYLPLKGLPYSSVRRVEKYIGFNVSFETFYSALSNPNSVIYTKPIHADNQNVHCHYGIVCSCFVSEVLDLPYRTPCIRFPEIPGMQVIDTSAFENLQLLDIVLNVKQHIAIITDIERDETGKVQFITVSESVLPFCRAVRYTPEEFTHYWLDNGYKIYRYPDLDRITYESDPFMPIPVDGPVETPFINRTLMTDYGNKANYRLGEAVEISVFDPAFTAVSVLGPDGTSTTYPVEEGKATVLPAAPGFYEARAMNGETASAPVEFAVTDLTLTLDRDGYRPGDEIRVKYENSKDEVPVAWQFNVSATDRGCKGGLLPEGLPANGEITLRVPDREEELELYLITKNRYGFYASDQVRIPKA